MGRNIMTQYFGYRCYTKDGEPLGWLYTYLEDKTEKLGYTNDLRNIKRCKCWKRQSTAERYLESYNKEFNLQMKGGYIQIEVITSSETLMNKTPQQKWNEQNPKVIKSTNQRYNVNRPVISFRPPPEILEWLEEERWDDDEGRPETNAALVLRKLNKLKRLEDQGY